MWTSRGQDGAYKTPIPWPLKRVSDEMMRGNDLEMK